MRRIPILVVWAALAGCGDERPKTPTVPAAGAPMRLSLEVVEGETAVVPVRYQVSQTQVGRGATIVLTPYFGTATAEDIVLMERTRVPVEASGEGTVEFGLRALVDGAVEGAETLVLRPSVLDHDPGTSILVRMDEIEVVITDGRPACSGVEVRVGEPVVFDELFSSYTTEITIEAPAFESEITWFDPQDIVWQGDSTVIYARARTLTDWRVEFLGERVRHRMTAVWWNEFLQPPRLLKMQVCGGPDYGKFIRCSPSGCAVHDEGS